MGRISKVKNHLTVDEIMNKIKETKGFWKVQKWMIIYNAKVEPRKAEKIAKHVGVSKATVNITISKYNREGVVAIDRQNKTTRGNANLSIEEEKEFLKQFFEKAEKGTIPTPHEIHQAFNKRVCKKVVKSTIYRLLQRHNWRKIVPRPFHPKRDKKEQEEFKKKL